MRIPFAVGCYQSRSLPLSRQRLVNAYVQTSPAPQKSQAPVFRASGIKSWITVGTDIRGAVKLGENLIVVSGTKAYSVTSAGVVTELGDIPGADTVSLAASADKVVCVADGDGYVIDSAVTLIADGDYIASTQVVWVDGYFVFLSPNAVFHCDLGDPTSYDPLAYDYPSGSPGRVIALAIEKRDLIHFKTDCVEVWYNKGTTPYAFGRSPDGFIELGCAAQRSPAKLDNSVFWLASDRTVRVLRGATPERVSTEVIEQAWAEYTTIDDAFGMSISADGRYSYVLTFPTEGKTWEYNIGTQQWNERESFGLGRWAPDGAVSIWNKTLVWSGNKLGELDPFTYTDWGDPQRVLMCSTPATNGPEQVFHDRLEIEAEMGVGLVTGQGSNPQLMLRWSDDGKTWSPEFWRTLGARGKHQSRAIWTRMGRSRSRIYELSYSDPTPFAFYGAYLNEDEALVA